MVRPFIETEHMVVERLVLGPLDNNCFVVRCSHTAMSVIIDAATEPDAIVAAAHETQVVGILTTHGHADHIGAARETSRRLDAPIHMHPADAVLAGWEPDVPLAHAQSIEVGRLAIEVMHTPGHTPGSVCFEVDGQVFTGDTLFPGGPGATRFPYSSFDQIMASLDTHLFVLPDATPFHPGHGDSSTIGDERPELEEWRRRGW